LVDLIHVDHLLSVFIHLKVSLQDLELDNSGALIDRDHFNVSCMNAKHSGHPILERNDAAISEELIKSELKPDAKHDSVSWHHVQHTASILVVLDEELESVDDSFVSELTAVFALDSCPSFLNWVPVSGLDDTLVLVINLISASCIVLNRHSEARGARATIKSELLLLRCSASVLDVVVPSLVDESWEASLTLLASVEAIPTVIHVGIEPIIEARVGILDVYWLHCTVHSIWIQVVEDHDSNVSHRALVRVPKSLFFASWDHLGRSRLDIVRNDRERWRQKRSNNASKLHAFEEHDYVVHASASELNTV